MEIFAAIGVEELCQTFLIHTLWHLISQGAEGESSKQKNPGENGFFSQGICKPDFHYKSQPQIQCGKRAIKMCIHEFSSASNNEKPLLVAALHTHTHTAWIPWQRFKIVKLSNSPRTLLKPRSSSGPGPDRPDISLYHLYRPGEARIISETLTQRPLFCKGQCGQGSPGQVEFSPSPNRVWEESLQTGYQPGINRSFWWFIPKFRPSLLFFLSYCLVKQCVCSPQPTAHYLIDWLVFSFKRL